MNAFTLKNEEIGYCQGMNFIVGKFLRILDKCNRSSKQSTKESLKENKE